MKKFKNPLKYSGDEQFSEQLLANWIGVSFFGLTSAMIFYNLSISKKLYDDRNISKIITIVLLGIVVGYLLVSLKNYNNRINDILEVCKIDKACANKWEMEVNNKRQSNTVLTIILIISQILIVYLIYNTI